MNKANWKLVSIIVKPGCQICQVHVRKYKHTDTENFKTQEYEWSKLISWFAYRET